jgi:hypothetical protein
MTSRELERQMDMNDERQCTAFAGAICVGSGSLRDVALKAKQVADEGRQVLLFDDFTSEPIEVDFRGTPEDVVTRLQRRDGGASPQTEEAPLQRGPGRPKLGVVAREVTLLPRHWEWLNAQPGGASVALRKLVETAKRENQQADRVRQAQNATYRFMSAIAGNLPGFENAARALFAGQRERFSEYVAGWPGDVRTHAMKLADGALPEAG